MATSQPPDHEIIREDNGVTVRTARKKETKSANQTPSASVLDEANNVALPPSPTLSSPERPQSPATPFLIAPRDKILPVVIHYNFEGDPTRLNKEFHSKYQPIGFSTYRVKSGIACQTSTYNDYLNKQKFLKENKVSFKLLTSVSAKPYKVVIERIPPPIPRE
jgi:hypothetical protein